MPPAYYYSSTMVKITTVGIVLILVGALGLIYSGFNYSRREKVFDIGPIHGSIDNSDSSSLPAVIGSFGLLGGIVMVFRGAKKKA